LSVSDQVLRQALGELEAAGERDYLDEEADRAAAERYYADLDAQSDPAAFFAALSALLETTHRLRPSYRPTVELYPWVDLQEDGLVRSLYTQEEYDPRALIEEAAEIEARRDAVRVSHPAAAADRASVEAAVEELEPYNCEHVVPQSWFEHHEPMRGDLHHLFTCERKCNSFRGNVPYADYFDRLMLVREQCGRTEAAGFEPFAGKGPAARATLYFLMRYPKLVATQSTYSEATVQMLLGWHAAETVGLYERHRNAAIFERQGNRNPLIDHPDWPSRIDFREGL
jgi:endonuclease G, mitochondrial